jgi:hypothetical protein
VDALVQMIRDLAGYEHSADSLEMDHAMLETSLFGDSPSVFAHVAEEQGRILGVAIWDISDQIPGGMVDVLEMTPPCRLGDLEKHVAARSGLTNHSVYYP